MVLLGGVGVGVASTFFSTGDDGATVASSMAVSYTHLTLPTILLV